MLWTLVQAANYKFLGGFDPVWYNLALSYLLLSLIGPLLFLLAFQDRLPASVSWVLAASPALMGNVLWLGLTGMEHLLFLVFSLAGIHLWLLQKYDHRLTAAASGCVAGLLTITRPEALLFAPLLLLASWRLAPQQRSRQDVAIFLSIWAVFQAIMLGTDLRTSGALLPATLKGRTWLYFHGTGGPHSLLSVMRFGGSWVQRLPRQFSPAYTHQMASIREIWSPASLFGIALLALVLNGAYFLLRGRPLRLTLLLIWSAVHFGIYLLTFPASGHGARYQPLCLLLISPLLFFGIYSLTCRFFPKQRNLVFAGVTALMLLASVDSMRTWRKVSLVGIAHINNTHGRIAEWMCQHVPTSARFAAFDIGRVSYAWGGKVIDLGGLVDPSYVHYLQEGRVPEYLADTHVQYVLLPGTGAEDLGFGKSFVGKKLVEYCSPTDDWLLGFRYTIHATQCQDLYELPTSEAGSPASPQVGRP